MISFQEGIKATKFARDIIESYVTNKQKKTVKFEKIFKQKSGVFVTINSFPSKNLRGCIGIPYPIMSLEKAIIEAGISATRDPRFPPLMKNELKDVIIEITILTKPEKIIVDDPKEYPSKINLGRDGLIVKDNINSGLLLPQVPIEQEWNKKEFLSNTCVKACLASDSWLKNEINIYKFTGQIFSEIEPNGEIMEKKLDGFNG